MKRKLALFAAAVLAIQLVLGAAVPTVASDLSPVKSTAASIVHKDVDGDLLKGAGSFDSEESNGMFSSVKTTWVEDENGGYIEGAVLPAEYKAYKFTPNVEVPAGKYLITFYVRTVYKGHKNLIRPQIYDTDGTMKGLAVVGINDQWFKVEAYIELAAPLSHINFRGGYPVETVVPYCIDEISIVPVNSLKTNPGIFGENVSDAEINKSFDSLQYIDKYADYPKWDSNEDYEVEGLMLNLDNTLHGIGTVKSEQEIIDFANTFKGTHITDMVMNIAESKCVYPSEVFFGWYGEPFTQMKDGVISNYTDNSGTHGIYVDEYYNHYYTLGLDYLKTLSKALPEAGINMWMSIRMNDAHDRGLNASPLLTRYYFEHPEFRRVQYDTKLNTYYAKIWDYSFPEVREKYLALLNESLDRYDVYGYQFEWQREMWLFHPGGEYAGIEIMNQFYRDADAIISIYEEKYGHEIKFSATVAPDLQTNYDFGLDIMTWVSEGILDMLVPMGRWATTCNEIPVALWKSLLDPYGVELVPCIEAGISTASSVSRQNPSIDLYKGASALYLSQGADKIQLHNILPKLNYRVKDNEKLAVYDAATLSEAGISAWWSIFTSCGSYEKLMTLDRKVIPTYNDVQQTWKSKEATAQLPVTTRLKFATAIRIGMGDIPEGAKVYLVFSTNRMTTEEDELPIVYVNSEPCKYVGIKETSELTSYEAAFSEHARYIYEIPESVYDDMWAVAEITATKRPGFSLNYAEIVIEVAK